MDITSEALTGIAPYMDPHYWNGLRPGVDRPDSAIPRPKLDASAGRAARRALVAYMEDTHTYFPERALSRGETFDAKDYPNGTVVLVTRERIEVYRSEIIDLLANVAISPVVRPLLSYDDFLSQRMTEIVVEAEGKADPWVVYRSRTLLGAVATSRKGVRGVCVTYVNPHFMIPNNFGSAMEIDKVYSRSETDPLSFDRVTALDICSTGGTPKQSKKAMASWLSSLVPRLGHAPPV